MSPLKCENMGKLIKEARQAMKKDNPSGKYGQKEISELLGISLRAYMDIESGKTKNIKISQLFELCEIFDCDLGYLIGEHAEKKRTATDINETTGLSEKAINNLMKYNENVYNEDFFSYDRESKEIFMMPHYANHTDVLNLLLENEDLIHILGNIANFLLHDFSDSSVIDRRTGTRMQISGETLSKIYLMHIQNGLVELKKLMKQNKTN